MTWKDNNPLNFNEKDCEELNRELKKSGQAITADKSDAKLAG